MSDLEIRNYERALRRRGWFRFVALVPIYDGRDDFPVSVSDPPRDWERATLAQWCGEPGYKNLMRRHVWAIPLYTLEDVAVLEADFRAEGVFDLVTRRRFFGAARSEDLEDGWTDRTFEQPGTLRRLYRGELAVVTEAARPQTKCDACGGRGGAQGDFDFACPKCGLRTSQVTQMSFRETS